MLSSKVLSQSRHVVSRVSPARMMVARLSDRSTSAKPTPSPDPNFNDIDAAGSHPIKPTVEWKNPLNKPEVKGKEYNPLNEGGFKKPNVSDEALDSVYPGPKYSPTMKSDNASNGMQPGDKKATKK